jgi:hypothetical protein
LTRKGNRSTETLDILSVAEQGFLGIPGSAGVAINSTGTRSIHFLSQKTNQPNEAAVDKV